MELFDNEHDDQLDVHQAYTYNPNTQQYVLHTEEVLGKHYVLDRSKVETIIKLYSNFDSNGFTAGDIAQRTSTPKKVIEYLVRALGITHSSLPFTDQKLEETKDDDSLVSELLLERRASISQKFERKVWQEIQEDSIKWRKFNNNVLSPFQKMLENWTPPKYRHVPTERFSSKVGEKELIVGCSDWHFGLVANERYLFNQKEWNIGKTSKAVLEYGDKLVEYIKGRPEQFSQITLAFLGDLIHGLDGFTDKGTKLDASPLREDQLEGAYNIVLAFIEKILTVSKNIRVLSVPGNHSSFGDYFLMKMLSIYFRSDKRISFQNTSKRFLMFSVGPNLFLMDHGYAPFSKNRLPAPGAGRENYVNSLFMSKPELTRNAQRFYYLSGDQHHMESTELTNAETYMFSTLVGGCRHADNSGYRSRPRQSCLIVDDEGVKEFIHFYFDGQKHNTKQRK